jgi:hypothetical protein
MLITSSFSETLPHWSYLTHVPLNVNGATPTVTAGTNEPLSRRQEVPYAR